MEWTHVLVVGRNVLPIHHFFGIFFGWTAPFVAIQTRNAMCMRRIDSIVFVVVVVVFVVVVFVVVVVVVLFVVAIVIVVAILGVGWW